MIRLTDVWYQVNKNIILSNFNLNVNLGEFIVLAGPSGAGKSTVLRLIHMEFFPTRGMVEVDKHNSLTILKKDIPLVRRKVGFVFQDFKLLNDRDVYENVAFALWATGIPGKRIKKRVFQVLAEVGLSHKRYSMINELSGGEQQRVAIARAMANEPFVLLADEPTGNLDSETTMDILMLLRKINKKGTAVIMVTHKEEQIEQLECRLVRIKGGQIV